MSIPLFKCLAISDAALVTSAPRDRGFSADKILGDPVVEAVD